MTQTHATGGPGVSKATMQVLLSASTYNTALAMPGILSDVPTGNASGYAVLPCGARPRATLVFAGTDAENETFGYQIIGLIGAKNNAAGFVPVKIAEGVVTLGAKALGASGAFIESATALLADTITETTSSPLSAAYSPGSDEVAALTLNIEPFIAIYARVSRDSQTAATMTVLGMTHDSRGGSLAGDGDVDLGDVDLVSGGTAMTALTTANGHLSNVANVLDLAAGVAVGSKTSTTSWDADSDEIDLGASHTYKLVRVSAVEDTYIVVNGSTDDPTTNPEFVPAGGSMTFPCAGQRYVHYKGVSAGGVVAASAYATRS